MKDSHYKHAKDQMESTQQNPGNIEHLMSICSVISDKPNQNPRRRYPKEEAGKNSAEAI